MLSHTKTHVSDVAEAHCGRGRVKARCRKREFCAIGSLTTGVKLECRRRQTTVPLEISWLCSTRESCVTKLYRNTFVGFLGLMVPLAIIPVGGLLAEAQFGALAPSGPATPASPQFLQAYHQGYTLIGTTRLSQVGAVLVKVPTSA